MLNNQKVRPRSRLDWKLRWPGHPRPFCLRGAPDNPELTLTVFGNRLKRKRSELIAAYDLAGLDDERIISVAQKEMAADQRPAEAKEAVN